MNSKKEKLFQKINPKFLEKTPKLSGVNGSDIDLNIRTNSLKEGAKKLMLRFYKKQELFFKSVSSEEGIELSDTKYKESYQFCQSISERLSLPFACDNGFKGDRPGKKYQDLKRKLEEQMSIRRQEDYKKRVSDYQKWKKEQEGKNGKDNDFEKDSCSSEDEVEEEKKGQSETSTNYVSPQNCEIDSLKPFKEDHDEKIVVSKENLEVNTEILGETESCSLDKYSLITPYQHNGAVFTCASEISQSDEELPPNLLSPSLKFNFDEPQLSKSMDSIDSVNKVSKEENIISSSKKGLFSQQDANTYDLNDALEFCSGKFSEAHTQDNNYDVGSPNNYAESIDDEELDDKEIVEDNEDNANDADDESYEFEEEDVENEVYSKHKDLETRSDLKPSLSKKLVKTKKRIIEVEESDDERTDANNRIEDSENVTATLIVSDEEDHNSDTKKTKPKTKRRQQVLHFSDEEDEESRKRLSDSDHEIEEASCCDEDEMENGVEEEENIDFGRLSVQYDSEENEIINPKEFFDKEAELSGSEFSGDEDEQDLDEFEEEIGDAEELDFDQIQSQLGKIHLRRLLDDDSKNVRLLQELFFEDGDLHTDENYKRFKWKNLTRLQEEESEEIQCDSKDDNVDSSDDDHSEDIQVRKERLETQLLLEKMREKGSLLFEDDLFKNIVRKVKMVQLNKELKARTSINKESLSGSGAVVEPKISFKNTRGSFLSRNEELLSRLAKITSSVIDNVLGPKHSKNFVFAIKSPEKTEKETSVPKKGGKRLMEDFESSKSDKKIKLTPKTTTPIPSILEMLG